LNGSYSEGIAGGFGVEICPAVFTLEGKEGVAVVSDRDGADPDMIQGTMDDCPSECMHWEEFPKRIWQASFLRRFLGS
jgi:ferredoxin